MVAAAFSEEEDGEDILSRLHSKDVDTMIAKELSAMSLQEREHCYHDIHGVSDTIVETPEFVEEKLAKLVDEIAKISGKRKDAYLQAVAQDKEYTTNKSFRLRFLRADLFNEKAAAERLVLFFVEKLKIFKPELLAKDIKISDFDEDERKCLESGFGQLVPQKGRAGGRCVLAWIVANTPKDTCDEQIAISKVSRNSFCEWVLE
jgi:anaerobic glycerol-3-phosphate dehydrogenase